MNIFHIKFNDNLLGIAGNYDNVIVNHNSSFKLYKKYSNIFIHIPPSYQNIPLKCSFSDLRGKILHTKIVDTVDTHGVRKITLNTDQIGISKGFYIIRIISEERILYKRKVILY